MEAVTVPPAAQKAIVLPFEAHAKERQSGDGGKGVGSSQRGSPEHS